jgi:hypothetical protein
MTRWFADAIEDIEAWQREAPIRVLTPADCVLSAGVSGLSVSWP